MSTNNTPVNGLDKSNDLTAMAAQLAASMPAAAPAPPVAQPIPAQTLEDMIVQLRAENEALKRKAVTQSVNRLSMKVSEKGALSVYGLGRFPVTLYREQWERLIALSPEIKEFIATNTKSLTTKQ